MSTGAASTAGPVLVFNAGSSSLKFAVVDPGSGARGLSGIAEQLGTPDAVLHVGAADGDQQDRSMPEAMHAEAVSAVLQLLKHQPEGTSSLIGVGHRVVHGGERFTESVLIDDDVLTAIDTFARLAPLHNPPALRGIEEARRSLPDKSHVAVFDTAFHQTMPEKAFRYAVPADWYPRWGIRRYGFHGTSHRFVSGRAAELLDRPPEELALVVAHLGNGCSATAVLGGISVDTTMGLTPLEGLVMGTRSGDIDPGAFSYLCHEANLSVDDITAALNQESGLLGLSGTSGDLRLIEEAIAHGDERASLALDVFVHRLSKAIAALVVSLGRIDALVFTGGIGEHSAPVRGSVIGSLGFLGLQVDRGANDRHGRETNGCISSSEGPAVLVVPTDEELMIARDTTRLVPQALARRSVRGPGGA